MFLYSAAIAAGLTIIAAIVHYFDPPPIFEEKYLMRSLIVSFFNVFTVSVLEFIVAEGHIPLFNIYKNITDHPFELFVIGSVLYVLFTDYMLWLNHYFLHNRHIY